jgi:putative membrane protein
MAVRQAEYQSTVSGSSVVSQPGLVDLCLRKTMKPTGNIQFGSHSIHYNWRLILVRVLVNMAALFLTVLLLRNISVTWSWGTFLILGIAMAILNAVVKPALQFLTLPLIFVSYGLVVIAINGVLLLLLSFLFEEIFVVSSLLAAFVGGAVIGVFTIFLENLFGLTPPIIDDRAAESAGGQP